MVFSRRTIALGLGAVATGVVAVLVTLQMSGSAAPTGGSAGSVSALAGRSNVPPVRVVGDVAHPRSYTFDQLKSFPQHTLSVDVPSPTEGTQHHTVTGPLLLDVAKTASPRFDGSAKYGELRFFAAVSRPDNDRVVFSWGELDPRWAGTTVILALTLDGAPLDSSGVRLVAGSDKGPGRLISPVSQVYLGDVNRLVQRN